MRKIISLTLSAALMISALPSVYAQRDYQQGTEVVYTADNENNENWTITVPAKLQPGKSGTVVLEGYWPSNKSISVTADAHVLLTNTINQNDKKDLTVTFPGITQFGNNTNVTTATETVKVAEIQNALFGKWVGHFNYNVTTATQNAGQASEITVSATDQYGNDLNAQSFVIDGAIKDDLLAQLKDSDLIDDNVDVDALIEVKSDDFDDLASTTFDVSSIAQKGDKVIILHFDEINQKWEFISEEVVGDNGQINANFSSYSPVAFVVVQGDGTIVPLSSLVYFETWYTNAENDLSIALSESGYCFISSPQTLVGAPIALFVVDGIIYADGEVVGQFIDRNTIQAINFQKTLLEPDAEIEILTYTRDPDDNKKITSYITVDMPIGYPLAHINNEIWSWEDFIASDYNRMQSTVTSGDIFIIMNYKPIIELNGYVYYDFDGISPITLNGVHVKATDKIIPRANYVLDAEMADATRRSFSIFEYTSFFYMPGIKWDQWLTTSYNGHYGDQIFADGEYLTYKGRRIVSPTGEFIKITDAVGVYETYYLE